MKPTLRRIATVLVLASVLHAAAGEVKLLLPLGRTAYQTNEAIPLAVVRSAAVPLTPGTLELTLTGADGTRMAFTFAIGGDRPRTTEHVRLNAWLLRPGRYTVGAACDGATASADLEVYPHIRRSTFRLVNWGRAKDNDQLSQGEDSLGYNLFYGHYANDEKGNFIRAGVDFMPNCVMSGGHQMDLRSECDWSDPYVVRGGTARVTRRALAERTRPNVPGIHFYDEPGLTWHKHPATGDWTPHGIPSQVRAYESAFGRKPISYHQVDPANPEHVRQWKHWARWKLGFMDAAWKDAQFGVSTVQPSFLSVTQSQYGFSAYTDGYYFNVVRSLPVVSGHGGYHSWGPGYFNPSYTLEVARARDLEKPCWYLPGWFGNTTADEFRLEQYLAFQTNIQGMVSPPDIDPFKPESRPSSEGVVESNHLMSRLGTIFTTMAPTRPPVAMLYCLSHLLDAQAKDRSVNYAHATPHGQNIVFTYLAGKLLHHQFLPVVDEDIVDGTLAASHKAIILTSITFLDPEVTAALEDFAANGGLVLLTADCTVKIKGAVSLGVTPALPDAALVEKLLKEQKNEEAQPYLTTGKHLDGARPLAKAIGTQLAKAGIRPVFECDNSGISASRQAAGDIEYLFAVNAEYDAKAGGFLSLKPAAATIALPDDGRPVYDAVRGGAVAELKKAGGKLAGSFRFGPGQMRVFARTARPIGTVRALTPVLHTDFTAAEAPIRLDAGATLLAADGRPLSGSAPLELKLIDPLGATRYRLLRATRQGTLTVRLHLAANDPAGDWKVVVRDLLANTEDTATFAWQPPRRCAALAGTAWRAVAFPADRERIFRFTRLFSDLTLVTGESPYNAKAAARIAAILAPWGVRCKTLPAAEANRPREITAEQAKTWVGIQFGRAKPGRANSPSMVGFDIDGPAILLGTPADNPLIAHVAKGGFLPYPPTADGFPGGGRGYLAWQRDAIGHGQESLTLIAYDAEGMAEAVGSLYEAAAGIAPLTPWRLPATHALAPATKALDLLPEPKVAWQVALPERAVAMKAQGTTLTVLSHDASLSTIDASGKLTGSKPAGGATPAQVGAAADPADLALARKHCPPTRIVKHAATRGALTAVGYWGGTVQLLDAKGTPRLRRQMEQDITGVAWLGDRIAVGLADGRIVALETK